MSKDSKVSGAYDQVTLSVAIIDPDVQCRIAAANSLRERSDLHITEYSSFPPT